MEIPDDVVSDVRKRLRRAAGQVQAVETDAGRGPRVPGGGNAALGGDEGFGAGRVQADRGWTHLLRGRPEKAEADGYALADVERMFMKLA
jgi:hypothetical protein